jgi:hypothetical protein
MASIRHITSKIALVIDESYGTSLPTIAHIFKVPGWQQPQSLREAKGPQIRAEHGNAKSIAQVELT